MFSREDNIRSSENIPLHDHKSLPQISQVSAAYLQERQFKTEKLLRESPFKQPSMLT